MEELKQRLLDIASRFAGTRIAILGDFVADVFVSGRPARLSREAPVPILHYEGEQVLPGSAGNVARNLAELGATPVCVGAVGKDEMGLRLRDSLSEAGADVSSLIPYDGTRTCAKTRIMAGDRHRAKQQVVRIDFEPEGVLDEEKAADLLRQTESQLSDASALIMSDYGRGSVTEAMIERCGKWAEDRIVIADSRYRLGRFHGITSATPNEAEFEACVGRAFRDGEGMAEAGQELRGRMDLDALLITRGNQGMMLCPKDGPNVSIPIVGADDVIDVTGAGDTVVAVFTLSLACGAGFLEAAHLANHAAGVVVVKAGTAACSPSELGTSIETNTAYLKNCQ